MALRLRCFREFAGSPFQRELNVLQTELLNLLCHAFCSAAEAWDTAPLTSCSCCQTRILCEHQRSSDTAFVNLGGEAPPARSRLQPLHEICKAGHRAKQQSSGETRTDSLLFTVTRGTCWFLLLLLLFSSGRFSSLNQTPSRS